MQDKTPIDEYGFPDWVPEDLRHMIWDFHKWHQGHKSWRRCAEGPYNHHPAIGSRVDAPSMTNSGTPRLIGRWVPTWNNMGCVVMDDGTWRVSSTCGLRVLGTAAPGPWPMTHHRSMAKVMAEDGREETDG